MLNLSKHVRFLVFATAIALMVTGCFGGLLDAFKPEDQQVKIRVDEFLNSISAQNENKIVSFFANPFVVDSQILTTMEFTGLDGEEYVGLAEARQGYFTSIKEWLDELDQEDISGMLDDWPPADMDDFPEVLLPDLKDIIGALNENDLDTGAIGPAIQDLADGWIMYLILSDINSDLNDDVINLGEVNAWFAYCGFTDEGVLLPAAVSRLLVGDMDGLEWGTPILSQTGPTWSVSVPFSEGEADEGSNFQIHLKKIKGKWMITYFGADPNLFVG